MKALIVVDMQNDFIDGSLGTQEAQAIVPAVDAKIKQAVRAGDAVFFTMDTHGKDYLQTQEGKNLPVPHCIQDTPGWQISGALTVPAAAAVIRKPGFGSPELAEALAELHARTPLDCIELVGLCTDICVLSNAMIIKARLSEVPMTVDAACCAGVTPQSHQNALAAMKPCQIAVTNEA